MAHWAHATGNSSSEWGGLAGMQPRLVRSSIQQQHKGHLAPGPCLALHHSVADVLPSSSLPAPRWWPGHCGACSIQPNGGIAGTTSFSVHHTHPLGLRSGGHPSCSPVAGQGSTVGPPCPTPIHSRSPSSFNRLCCMTCSAVFLG